MTTEATTTGQPEAIPLPRPPALSNGEWRFVLWDLSDSGILTVRLNRPERLNALNFGLLREMIQLVEYGRARQEVRVIALRGEGDRAFCSGDDLKGMEAQPGIDSSATVHHQLITLIRETPKPVVALIRGWALGHGFELACACDLRLCGDDIEVGDHRVNRAIGMNGGTSWFLQRIVGYGRALEMLMTGSHLDAKTALDWGWANCVWPAAEFEQRAQEYLEMLAGLPTIAAGAFKAALEYSSSHGLRDSLAYELLASGRNRGTEDAAEGRSSFHEKRKPVYKGR
jgi:enoyl-CoA hydratase/carnithine racemase